MPKNRDNAELHELFCELRGMPTKCDQCGKDTPAEDLDPVSGGEWICWTCTQELFPEIKPKETP